MVVAVIGAGTIGLITLKNLLEEGIDAVGFERESEVGGLWVQKADPTVTTSLPTTQVNFSKQRLAASDFPFDADTPTYPYTSDVAQYFSSYANHFDLRKHIRFNSSVISIDFAPSTGSSPSSTFSDSKSTSTAASEDRNRQYLIKYEHEGKVKEFIADKLCLATGLNSSPFIPKVDGVEHFKGEVLHSRSFRNASQYAGKEVVVVGSRASAADVSSALCKAGATKVYLSHRGGLLVLPRNWLGKPFDHHLSHRLSVILAWIDLHVPLAAHFSAWSTDFFCRLVQRTSFTLLPEWGFKSMPQIDAYASIPTISDDLVSLIQSGKIASVPSIKCIQPDGSINFNTFSDSPLSSTPGLRLPSPDAIIFATGYHSSADRLPLSPVIFAHLFPSAKAAQTSSASKSERAPNGLPFLWEYCLPPSLPTMAVLVNASGAVGAPLGQDIQSMWLSSLWSGRIKMPSTEQMIREAEGDLDWLRNLRKLTTSITPGVRPYHKTLQWASQAGCEFPSLSDYFSPSSWWSWFKNPSLYSMINDGVATGAIFRLKGRKAWAGAEEAIYLANGKEKEWQRKQKGYWCWGDAQAGLSIGLFAFVVGMASVHLA